MWSVGDDRWWGVNARVWQRGGGEYLARVLSCQHRVEGLQGEAPTHDSHDGAKMPLSRGTMILQTASTLSATVMVILRMVHCLERDCRYLPIVLRGRDTRLRE